MNKLTAEKCREFIAIFKSLEREGHLALTSEYHLQAYEIALPILEQQERSEGEWVEWGGGACPPVTGRVQMKWADGSLITGSAGDWRWSHEGGFSNIIAYRIIPERATNQNGEQ